MELDEAIEYEEEMAEINQAIAYNTNDDNWMDIAQCEKCAEEHRQLAEWLKELKHLRNLVAYSKDFHCTIEKAEKELLVAEDKISYIESLNKEV